MESRADSDSEGQISWLPAELDELCSMLRRAELAPPISNRLWTKRLGEGLRYVTTDEVVDGHVTLVASHWPKVDAAGRRVFPSPDDESWDEAELDSSLYAYDVQAGRYPQIYVPVERFQEFLLGCRLAKHIAVDRPTRIGDVFAMSVRSLDALHHRQIRPDTTWCDTTPFLDVTKSARSAAQLALSRMIDRESDALATDHSTRVTGDATDVRIGSAQAPTLRSDILDAGATNIPWMEPSPGSDCGSADGTYADCLGEWWLRQIGKGDAAPWTLALASLVIRSIDPLDEIKQFHPGLAMIDRTDWQVVGNQYGLLNTKAE